MDPLDQRVEILHQSGLLSDAHAQAAHALRDLFLKRYGILLTEDNAAAFFTHFCMALHRQETGEFVEPVSEPIMDSLRDEDDYENAVFIADEMDRSIALLSDRERGYIITHLLVLLSGIRQAYDDETLGQE